MLAIDKKAGIAILIVCRLKNLTSDKEGHFIITELQNNGSGNPQNRKESKETHCFLLEIP